MVGIPPREKMVSPREVLPSITFTRPLLENRGPMTGFPAAPLSNLYGEWGQEPHRGGYYRFPTFKHSSHIGRNTPLSAQLG